MHILSHITGKKYSGNMFFKADRLLNTIRFPSHEGVIAVERWCWVTFSAGPSWILVSQGPMELAVGAGIFAWLIIFPTPIIPHFFLPLSLGNDTI